MIQPLGDALSAYDRELPLLKTLEERYGDWLRQLCEGAARRLNAELGGRAEFEATDEDGIWGFGFELSGKLARAGLDVRLWSAAFYGGSPGIIRIGAYLPRQLPRGLPTAEEIRPAVEAVYAQAGYSAPGAGEYDVHDCGDDHVNIGWRDVSIAAPDVFAQVLGVMREAVTATETASKVVVAAVPSGPAAKRRR